MKFGPVLIVLLLAVTVKNSYAIDYFVVDTDTTFCAHLTYTTTIQGYLKSIEYDNADNEHILIEGRKNVPDVLTFCIDNIFIDKTPLKANDPDGYIRYTERAVDGKLKVYLSKPEQMSGMHYNAPTPTNPNGYWSQNGAAGSYRFFIKMPDGTYYKINSKSKMEKYIKPYLLECAKFRMQYKGDFSTEEDPFMDMIELYNSLCE